MQTPLGLYVHIPFCKSKCHYCDFASDKGSAEEIDRYLDLLEREAEKEASTLPIETVFVGGGTPSLLSDAQTRRLFEDIVGRFAIMGDAEITSEANPESMEAPKARLLASLGVNRVSLGAQSFHDDELMRLGRPHAHEHIGRAVAALREAGITNINLDLICGFPGNTPERLGESLDRLIELAPAHASVYIYQLETDSHWGRIAIEPPDDALQADLYYLAKDSLEAAGYRHYELSNFAKPGRECRHNLKYWRSEPWLGIGLSAASYRGGARRVNPSDHAGYERAVREGGVDDGQLDGDSRLREELMLEMRLLDGVTSLPTALGERARRQVERAFERHVGLGLVERRGQGFALSRRGLALSNELFVDLI